MAIGGENYIMSARVKVNRQKSKAKFVLAGAIHSGYSYCTSSRINKPMLSGSSKEEIAEVIIGVAFVSSSTLMFLVNEVYDKYPSDK